MEDQILRSVDRFVEEFVEPRAAEIDLTDEYPQDLHDKAADLGLFGLAVPEKYGGVPVKFPHTFACHRADLPLQCELRRTPCRRGRTASIRFANWAARS